MARVNTPAKYQKHTLEEIDRALLAMILNGGNSALAHARLHDQGLDIPYATLHSWKHKHRGRYEELLSEQGSRIAEMIAEEAEAIAIKAARIEHQILDSLAADVPNLSPADKTTALRNVTTTKSLNIDKVASPLRGRPSRITEVRDPEEILRSIERKLAGVINGTATEETPQLAEEAP